MVTRRACSSISGPLIRMPSCAPRPVPTMSAVGVASPSAQGQAMMSTATAAVNASAASPVERSQPASVASEIARTTGTKTRRDPVGEALHRRLARLRLGHEPGDLGERRVGADARGAHDEPAESLIVPPATSSRRADLDRNRLAGQHRAVDRRAALDDDAVRGDPLARPNDEQVADRERRRSGTESSARSGPSPS